MAKAIPYTVGIAVLLALAGCSGQPDEDPATSASSARASEPAEPTEAPSSEGQGPAATGLQRSAAELEAVLTAVSEGESLNAQVIPDEQLRTLLEEGSGTLGDVAVRPEECNAFAESDPTDITAEANLAEMTFAGESSLQPDRISLSSVPSSQAVEEQIATSRAKLQVCSDFEMDIGNDVISASVGELDVQTDAEQEIAVRTTVRVPGSIQESVTVTGVVGGTSVNVVVGSSGDAEADVQRAAALVNAVVAELAAL